MILVTGGTGLLGSHLIFDLVSTGKEVRAIYRNEEKRDHVSKVFSYYASGHSELLRRVQWVKADLMDHGAMTEAMAGISQVYHAGAVVSFYPSDHKAMLRVNVEGTADLVDLALERQIEKFIYVSSVATLGRADNNGLSDEETHWKTSRKNSVYSVSKYGAEREVWRGMAEGLNGVIVNPSVILGPGFWGDGNSGFFSLVWEGLKYYTTGMNGFVDVRDVSQTMIRLMESSVSGERFIVSSENRTYQEIFGWIAQCLGKPAPSVNVPPWLSGIAWRAEAIRSLFAGGKPSVTREMAVSASQVYTYSNEKIKQRLNYTFIPVQQSIRETCEIFLKDHR